MRLELDWLAARCLEIEPQQFIADFQPIGVPAFFFNRYFRIDGARQKVLTPGRQE
jgi:hypothetical protein